MSYASRRAELTLQKLKNDEVFPQQALERCWDAQMLPKLAVAGRKERADARGAQC